MAVFKCISCGLLNYAGEITCKRCDGQLVDRAFAQTSQMPPVPVYADGDYAPAVAEDSVTAEISPALSEKEQLAIDRYSREMRLARNAALFIAALNLIVVLKIAFGTHDSELWHSWAKENAVAWPFYLAVSFSAIAFGIHLKSRIAVVAAPVNFIVSPALWIFVLGQRPAVGLFTLSPEDGPQMLFGLMAVLFVMGLALLFCLCRGIRGVFDYYSLLKNTGQA